MIYRADYKVPAKKRRTYKAILILLILAILTGAVFILYSHNKNELIVPAPKQTTQTQQITSAKGRYLFNGTIFWGRAVEKWSAKPDGTYDYSQPFSGLNTFDRSKYDAWVADMECPITNKNIPYQVQVDQLKFNCRPEYLKQAAKYFNFLNLANNHSGDQGLSAFNITRANIQKAGIKPFGNYDPSILDDDCQVIKLPLRLNENKKKIKTSSIPVAFCAYHYFFRTPKDAEISVIKEYSKVMPVFAFVHMGQEYLPKATSIQQGIAHSVIDAGADFVIANNPHWVQNSEVYKDKLIFYSTGNFIFDQIDSETTRSASVELDMELDYDKNLEMWLDLDCGDGECFNMAKQLGLERLRPKYNFDVIAGERIGHVTKKADPTTQQAIENRTNWVQTKSKLNN